MCGIVGFIGEQPAAPILLEGLSKLEYRGYDSAGIAVRNEKTDKIAIVKAKGRLKILAEKTDNGKSVRGTCGSVIHDGPLTANLPRIMHILTARMINPLFLCITGLSKTIKN